MIRLLDRTLSTLEYSRETITGNKLAELLTLLSRAGADWVEIPTEAYCLMGTIPDGVKAILRVHHSKEAAEFPGFDYYISKSREISGDLRFINEIHVNDVKEIELLNRFQDLRYVCVTGLDDLLLGPYGREMKKLMTLFGKNIWFCPENDCHCATALALEWIAQGGRNVCVSFMGQGGYAAFEEVILGARIAYRQKVGTDLTLLPRILSLISDMAPVEVAANKAALGSRIFTVESGVHADALSRIPRSMSPIRPNGWVRSGGLCWASIRADARLESKPGSRVLSSAIRRLPCCWKRSETGALKKKEV